MNCTSYLLCYVNESHSLGYTYLDYEIPAEICDEINGL